jgi:predicted Rossmann fold nucleotide-binding protein DprA/Smf involved in DNA uptake
VEQNRDLWVDKAGVSSKCSAGTARLAEEGALLFSSVKDILNEWRLAGASSVLDQDADKEGSVEQDEGAGLASSMAAYLDMKL